MNNIYYRIDHEYILYLVLNGNCIDNHFTEIHNKLKVNNNALEYELESESIWPYNTDKMWTLYPFTTFKQWTIYDVTRYCYDCIVSINSFGAKADGKFRQYVLKVANIWKLFKINENIVKFYFMYLKFELWIARKKKWMLGNETTDPIVEIVLL